MSGTLLWLRGHRRGGQDRQILHHLHADQVAELGRQRLLDHRPQRRLRAVARPGQAHRDDTFFGLEQFEVSAVGRDVGAEGIDHGPRPGSLPVLAQLVQLEEQPDLGGVNGRLRQARLLQHGSDASQTPTVHGVHAAQHVEDVVPHGWLRVLHEDLHEVVETVHGA